MKKIALTVACGLLCSASVLADGWGGIKGQVVLKGDAPEPVLLHAKGAPIKDAAVCAAADTYADDLVVDKDTKGIANVFIYLAKAPKTIHPDLKDPSPAKVIFDQNGCQFIPHALTLQAGQTVEVISHDAIAHNTHTNPIKNTAQNVLIAPNTAEGSGVDIENKLAERLPFKVTCDYHPWMTAYWLVVDHPYCAVTDKEGRFTIENLPEGSHTFIVWHEKKGYLDRKYAATVKDGQVSELKPIEVNPSDLK